MENKKIIYKATNSVNGDVYVGVTTKSIKARKQDQICKSSNGEETKFYKAISTYGADAFNWEQIDTAFTVDELAKKEKQYIFEYKAKESGYNSDEGGGFKKTVYQYNLVDGNLINSYKCLTDAGNEVNATKQSISRACLSVNNIFNGFYWSYEFKEPFKSNEDNRKKEVLQYNLKGDLLNRFNSVADSSKFSGISKTCISRVCRGERIQSGGFVWRFID